MEVFSNRLVDEVWHYKWFSFVFIFVGQAISGVTWTIVVASAPKVSSTWFRINERSSVTILSMLFIHWFFNGVINKYSWAVLLDF